jgi:thiol-disulfide isomerase/thioredoxin
MRFLALSLAVLALASCSKPQPQQPANEAAASVQAGPVKGVDRSHKGQPMPQVRLDDGTMLAASAQDAKPLLVNIWATWCAPCVKELPTIDRLAKLHHDKGDLRVIAVSQDDAPHASVAAFLDKLKITNVATAQDSKMALSGSLGPDTVLPTTILYDAQGKEVWRYIGDLDWTGAEAAKLLAEGGVGQGS